MTLPTKKFDEWKDQLVEAYAAGLDEESFRNLLLEGSSYFVGQTDKVEQLVIKLAGQLGIADNHDHAFKLYQTALSELSYQPTKS